MTEMAPREDLINSAVTFLQDPSVSTSSLDQRKAFLQSKNLTAEEIQIALARAGEDPSTSFPSQNRTGYYAPSQRGAPPPGYGYNYGYGPYASPWPPQQMQEPPRRDWRDWFIMATVTTGLGWGLYTVAKRYVAPLILPPTPPQIEQDKESIDASFNRAFALIDQLSTDTAALKEAETQRQEKLDNALDEVSSVIAELKAANKRREDDARRIGDDVRGLREMVPKALEGWKSQGDERLRELGSELRSLKMLVGNRVGGGTAQAQQAQAQSQSLSPGLNRSGATTPSGQGSAIPGFSSNAPPTANGSSDKPENSSAATGVASASTSASAPAPGITAPKRDTASPFSFDNRPATRSIPAWQMAASKKGSETTVNGSSSSSGSSGSGSGSGEASGSGAGASSSS